MGNWEQDPEKAGFCVKLSLMDRVMGDQLSLFT